jgi:Fe-S-cluster containining protein
MILPHLLQHYEGLVTRADLAFQRMERDYGRQIRCKQGCSNCCHAVFGLFLIEAVFLQGHFNRLDRVEKRRVIQRGRKADRDLERLQERLKGSRDDRQGTSDSLGRERIRCPLLNDDRKCVLYPHRPITCRVYGIPAMIHGKVRVCGKAGFEGGESYPAFDLDGVQRRLYSLSGDLLSGLPGGRGEKASLLISVSKALQTPSEELIRGCF